MLLPSKSGSQTTYPTQNSESTLPHAIPITCKCEDSILQRLGELKAQHSELLQLSGATLQLIGQMGQDNMAKKQPTLRSRKIILALCTACLMLGTFLIYKSSQRAFNHTITLYRSTCSEEPTHSPIGYVFISVEGLTFSASISPDGQAVFANLPQHLEGKRATLHLSLEPESPYYSQDSLITLEPEHCSLVWLSKGNYDEDKTPNNTPRES